MIKRVLEEIVICLVLAAILLGGLYVLTDFVVQQVIQKIDGHCKPVVLDCGKSVRDNGDVLCYYPQKGKHG